jgi:hypothetical protein
VSRKEITSLFRSGLRETARGQNQAHNDAPTLFRG